MFKYQDRQHPPKKLENELNGHPVVRFYIYEYGQQQRGAYLKSNKSSFLPGSNPYAAFLVVHPWPSGNTGSDNRGTPGLIAWGKSVPPHDDDACVIVRLGPGPRSNIPRDIKGLDVNSSFTNYLPKYPGRASLVTYYGGRSAQLGDDENAPLSLERAVLLETSFDGISLQIKINGDNIKDPIAIESKNIQEGHLLIGVNPIAELNSNLNYGDFFRGDMAEILIYNRKIEDEERKDIQEYLRSKDALWGGDLL